MPAAVTARERVLRTLRCEETDRVPLHDLLRNDAAFENVPAMHEVAHERAPWREHAVPLRP